jgi:hypothetical protein
MTKTKGENKKPSQAGAPRREEMPIKGGKGGKPKWKA